MQSQKVTSGTKTKSILTNVFVSRMQQFGQRRHGALLLDDLASIAIDGQFGNATSGEALDVLDIVVQ